MTRPTSAENYQLIKDNGLLGKRQWQVYDCVYRAGPMTQSEAWVWILNNSGERPQQRSISPRFAELEAKGVLATVGERPCNVTGKTATVWEVTAALPSPPEKRPSIKDRIKALEASVKELQRLVSVYAPHPAND